MGLDGIGRRWPELDKVIETERERKEYLRLKRIYKSIPANQYAVTEGLIRQAARLRARLDALWQDLQEKGETEWFSQSPNTEPYERERPASRTFTATDKSYQQIIRQLNELVPTNEGSDALEDFMNERHG